MCISLIILIFLQLRLFSGFCFFQLLTASKSVRNMNKSADKLDTMDMTDHDGGGEGGHGRPDMMNAMLMTGGLDAHALDETPGLKWFFVMCLAVQSVFGTIGSLLVSSAQSHQLQHIDDNRGQTFIVEVWCNVNVLFKYEILTDGNLRTFLSFVFFPCFYSLFYTNRKLLSVWANNFFWKLKKWKRPIAMKENGYRCICIQSLNHF